MKYDQFFTPVQIEQLNQIDSFDHQFGFIGSCFSDHMHQRFRYHGLQAWLSPFGTTYNPLSIVNQLLGSIDLTDKFNIHSTKNHSFYWETSHKIIHSNPEGLKIIVERLRAESLKALQEMDTLFITLGSAWVYELNSTGLMVANCHKLPASNFTKRLLSITEITDALHILISRLNKINPFLKIVFTVSPVRHLRDGIVENSRSKACLIEACHQVVDTALSATYFPAYEIVMDELRDYRFFERDGAHPTEFAIDIVFDKLQRALFTESLTKVFNEVAQIRRMENHRFSEESNADAMEKHRQSIAKRKHDLDELHPVRW